MNPLENLEAQIKKSMLARDKCRTDTLRGLKAALTYHLQQTGRFGSPPTQDDFLLVVRREIKKRQDAIAEFQKAARSDLADAEKSQLTILEEFLPAALSDAELDELVKKAIAQSGATSKKQFGLAMKAAQELAAGRADNAALSKRLQTLLPG
jgi:uncharacterized protein YqeY